ncbi:hypothetical protein ABB07_25360 [Streptomyces incarnatus]|uniref:Uncharacterized protein n=2 Tax=Streptomyces incarnatus TaxID=665007 RepID=A0ABN4GHG7_9ACTN|nr:hypothetical protein ABB07_25360 [Streptomyces incarnatus]
MIEFFQQLEPPEGIWMELLRRTVVMTRSPDPVHNTNAEPRGEGESADYRSQRKAEFGELMPLESLGVELGTSGFATYEKVRPHRYP